LVIQAGLKVIINIFIDQPETQTAFKYLTIMKIYKTQACLALAILMLLSCGPRHGLLSDQVVQTKYGMLKGALNAGGTVVSFKGVPYAAPPVGDLRWKETRPPVAWEGIRDASRFCASCMQNLVYTHLPSGPWTEEFMVQDSVSEDCLFLNIWAPVSKNDVKSPVLVFFHGGAFQEGSGSIDVYNGEELAKKGIIVITVNYRLGALGFLAHPGLTAESPNHVSGNYGLFDQLASLKWVKENISVFGGDPSRVTIGGQSAGAASVTALLVSPLGKGLFSGAITQSGSTFTGWPAKAGQLTDAEQAGMEFVKSKGASSLADLRAISAKNIIARDPGARWFGFGPVVDGYFLTAGRNKVYAEGQQNDVVFMSGMNADETEYMGNTGSGFKALYPSAGDQKAAEAAKLAGQEQGRLNTWLWMEYRAKTSKTNAYEYYFDRAIPWPEHPEFGAFHTGEIPYVFNNLKMLRGHKLEKADTLTADRISSYWVNFVKTGDPNGSGLPRWEPFNAGKHEVMELGEKMGMIPVAASDEKISFLKEQLIKADELQ
jgi:para-nitrobenzyl esterase